MVVYALFINGVSAGVAFQSLEAGECFLKNTFGGTGLKLDHVLLDEYHVGSNVYKLSKITILGGVQ